MNASAKNALTFLAGFGCVVIYYWVWHIFRFDGWRASYNIFGFVLLALSWPWYIPFNPSQLLQELGVSHETKLLLSIMPIAIGFGINLLIVKTVICYATKKFKRSVGT
jgi:hypothetical protein